MSQKYRLFVVADDTNPVEKAFQAYDQLEERLESEEGEVEEAEKTLQDEEEKGEQEIEQVAGETQEGEASGNAAEVEDAEQNEQKLLEFLESQEELVESIIEGVHKETQYGEGEAQELGNAEAAIGNGLRQVALDIQQAEQDLTDIRGGDARIYEKDVAQLREDMEVLRRRAQAVDGILDRQIRVLQALEREEQELRSLENLEKELLEELEMDKKEVEELIRDSKRIQKREDIELAEKEGEEIKQLLQQFQEEGKQTQQLAEEIGGEADAVAEDIKEDEELVGWLESADQSLAELEQIIQEERDDLMMVVQSLSRKNLKSTLSEIEQTREVIEGVLQGDRNRIEEAEDTAAKLASSAGDLARSAPVQTAANTGSSLIKYGAVGAVLFSMVVILGVIGAFDPL